MQNKLIMSKSKDTIYLAERLRRASLRKIKRKEARSYKYYHYGRGTAECSMCGGAMTWCNGCQVWSSTCCCQYGTCQCS